MRSFTTLEPKKHGDSLFPYASYKLRYPKNSNILDLHWHSELEFLIVTEGSGKFQLDETEYILSKGQGIIINSGVLHQATTLEDHSCCFTAIVFDPGLISGSKDDRINIKYIDPVVKSIRYMNPILNNKVIIDSTIIQELLNIANLLESNSITYELDIKIGLLNVFSLLFKMKSSKMSHFNNNVIDNDKSGNIKDALLYIHKNYNKDIMIKDISTAAGMSEAYFSRTFKLLVNKTVFEYIHEYRINSAIELLKKSDRPISTISQDVGYENCSYFIKRFKMLLNTTPLNFRNKQLTNGSSFN